MHRKCVAVVVLLMAQGAWAQEVPETIVPTVRPKAVYAGSSPRAIDPKRVSLAPRKDRDNDGVPYPVGSGQSVHITSDELSVLQLVSNGLASEKEKTLSVRICERLSKDRALGLVRAARKPSHVGEISKDFEGLLAVYETNVANIQKQAEEDRILRDKRRQEAQRQRFLLYIRRGR